MLDYAAPHRRLRHDLIEITPLRLHTWPPPCHMADPIISLFFFFFFSSPLMIAADISTL